MVEGINSVAAIQDYTQRTDVREQAVHGTHPGEESVKRLLEHGTNAQAESKVLDKEQIQQAVSKINKTMETYNTELRFQFHEKSGEYVIKLINKNDDSVIREIPPERVLNMVAYFKEMLGLVVDKFA